MEKTGSVYFKSAVSPVSWLLVIILIVPIVAAFWYPSYGIRWTTWIRVAIVVAYLVFVYFWANQNIYCIKDGELGLKRYLHWEWYSIANIRSVQKVKSSSRKGAYAMSFDRVRIRFVFTALLNEERVLEVSPRDRDKFIEVLRKVNPDIIVLPGY